MTYLIIDEDKGTITESRDQYHHKPTLEEWDIIEKKDRVIISGRQIIFEFDWHNQIPLEDIEEEYILTKRFYMFNAIGDAFTNSHKGCEKDDARN